jgi:hypothetical protein
VDFALGWGKFESREVDEWIKWRQSNRWYHYRWKGGCPYPANEIISHSANVHIIPANDNVWKAAIKVGKNDRVYMEGYLVYIMATKGSARHPWNSSLSRTDSGDHSCEVFYVEKLIWDGKEYT